MGYGHLRNIETQGLTSGKTAIMLIKEHKIFIALSESLYWNQVDFHVFYGTFIEKASDGSGSILNHANIRSDIRQHWHYGH